MNRTETNVRQCKNRRTEIVNRFFLILLGIEYLRLKHKHKLANLLCLNIMGIAV